MQESKKVRMTWHAWHEMNNSIKKLDVAKQKQTLALFIGRTIGRTYLETNKIEKDPQVIRKAGDR